MVVRRDVTVSVEALPGGRWQAAHPRVGMWEAGSLPSLHRKVREAVAAKPEMVGRPVVFLYFFGDDGLEFETTHIRGTRAKIEELERGLTPRTEAAARRLVDELKMSARDAGALLGITYQRVQQITGTRPDE